MLYPIVQIYVLLRQFGVAPPKTAFGHFR